jgi:two-component system, NarL family, response regulator NreC
MQKIRVVVFSKYQIVRTALRYLLGAAPDVETVAEVATQQQAQRAMLQSRPDVILIESVEATNSAIPKLAESNSHKHKVAIVVLTNEGNVRVVRAMLRAGVSGYVLKDSSESELLLALRSAARGRKFLDSSLIDEISLEGTSQAHNSEDRNVLSKRELQVLRFLVHGYTGPEIARDLRLSTKTVETYRSRIYEKLDLNSRADLVRYAIHAGLLSVNETLPD